MRVEKALAIISFNKIKDLHKIAKGDEMLMKVEKKIEDLSKNPDLVKYIDDKKAMEFGHKMDIQDVVEKATKEVTERNVIEMAKLMLKDKLDTTTISKYTGLSE